MKRLISTTCLTLVASSVNATVTETVAKQFGLAIVDSLVELQLQTDCSTHIASTGSQVLIVDSECISNVSELLTTLETEPSAKQLVSMVSAFMDANNIPKMH